MLSSLLLFVVPCGTLSPEVSVDAEFVFFFVLKSVFLLVFWVCDGCLRRRAAGDLGRLHV